MKDEKKKTIPDLIAPLYVYIISNEGVVALLH